MGIGIGLIRGRNRVVRNKKHGAIYLPTDEETGSKNPSTMGCEVLNTEAPSTDSEKYSDIEEKKS